MFGSNFFGNFGLPDFPYQGADAQGGYLGANVPMGQNTAPAAGQPGQPSASQPSIAALNPLAGGPLSPGGGQAPQQPGPEPSAPAAGIGSPFGKGSL